MKPPTWRKILYIFLRLLLIYVAANESYLLFAVWNDRNSAIKNVLKLNSM